MTAVFIGTTRYILTADPSGHAV